MVIAGWLFAGAVAAFSVDHMVSNQSWGLIAGGVMMTLFFIVGGLDQYSSHFFKKS